jgi:hypothetical protein
VSLKGHIDFLCKFIIKLAVRNIVARLICVVGVRGFSAVKICVVLFCVTTLYFILVVEDKRFPPCTLKI